MTINRHTFSPFTNILRISLLALCSAVVLAAPALPTSADTLPAPGIPETVSADPLPTAQIDGMAWAQVVVGNTVYVAGRFTEARPAGVKLHGTGTVSRTNLLAYDITTGNLIPSFNHSFTGATPVDVYDINSVEARTIAVSPDGKRLYVGGKFTKADGQPRTNIAAFDLATNTLAPGFTSGPNAPVRAVAATNTTVYIGGAFSNIGGQTRNRLAAYTTDGTLLSGWKPNVTAKTDFSAANYPTPGATVAALLVMPAQGNLIVGGYFSAVNGSPYYSLAAVKLDTGTPVTPWGSTSATYPIRDQLRTDADPSKPNGLGITSLSTDGSQVYLTSYNYAGAVNDGGFEGTAAINPANGNLIWIDDCHGDSYGSFPRGNVLYSVSHAHDCSAIGGFPESPSRRALAQTTYATGTNGHTPVGGASYPDHYGQPRSSLVTWYPNLNTGDKSSHNQAAWTISGNSNYIVLGGEFTTAETTEQQGLVRYGTKELAPNKVGPSDPRWLYTVQVSPVNASGQATVSFPTTWDPDNSRIAYTVFRGNDPTPRYSVAGDSQFGGYTTVSFTDTGLTPGATVPYYVVAKDAYGNGTAMAYSAVDDANPGVAYTGTWSGGGTPYGDYMGNEHWTTQDGATATLKFIGSSVELLTNKGPDQGNISISIDGGAIKKTVNTQSGDKVVTGPYNVWQSPAMSNDLHTITVTKTSGAAFRLDAFVVKGTYLPTVVNGVNYLTGTTTPINSNWGTYGAGWYTAANRPSDYQQDLVYSVTPGSVATYSFTGTGISLLSPLGASGGKAQLFIDGVSYYVADTYSPTYVPQKNIFTLKGMSNGRHTITVKHLAGTGSNLNIDAFVTYGD